MIEGSIFINHQWLVVGMCVVYVNLYLGSTNKIQALWQ